MPFRCKLKWASLCGLAILTVCVALGVMRNFDISATITLQKFALDIFDRLSLFFTIIGSGEITGIIVAAVSLWLYFTGRKKSAFYLLLFFASSVAIELIMKFLVPQPKVFPEFKRGLKIPVAIYSPFTPFAYPSGHATRTVILAIIFNYLASDSISFKRYVPALKFVIFTGALLMLVSRIYDGSHWCCDVIGGICLGSYLALNTLEKFDLDKAATGSSKN